MASLDIINVVYGEKFTRFFIDVSLPSQLSPSNIPGLIQRQQSCYTLYTTKADAEVIAAAPSYRRLCEVIPVRLEYLELDEIRDPAYRERMGLSVWSLLSMIHKMAIRQATRDHLIFLAPDWVIADGTFAAMEARLDQGYEAIVICGPRVDWEMAEAHFRDWVIGGEYLTVPGRVLVDVMLKYPHRVLQNLTHDIRWEADVFNTNWPSILIWRHDGVGFIAHSCHLHPVAVRRETGNADFTTTIDGDYLSRFGVGSDKIYFATDSDEICIADVTPQDYGQQSFVDQPLGLFFFLGWLDRNTQPINKWFMLKPFVFKMGGCDEGILAELTQATIRRIANVLEVSRRVLGR